ncbi:hypothetical protein [uncultured Campylobacter sp.]|uniref:hypothetical protein n=1 Tax=uncultured Campylobacter sp. TaxID=218934 RepID=UPI002639A686|nr:hypothetical protein [uncultured Campylobacter sp.]
MDETSSASLRQQIKSLHHQDHQCRDSKTEPAHGSDTGDGVVKATPQRQNRYHHSRKNSAVIKKQCGTAQRN